MYDAKLLENDENNQSKILTGNCISDLCYFEKYPNERLLCTKTSYVPIEGLINKGLK